MLSKFGLWLARGGATTFTIWGFLYFFDEFNRDKEVILCFLTAAVFYGIDQITTAINNLKEDTTKLEE